jgi:hypothetical protein
MTITPALNFLVISVVPIKKIGDKPAPHSNSNDFVVVAARGPAADTVIRVRSGIQRVVNDESSRALSLVVSMGSLRVASAFAQAGQACAEWRARESRPTVIQRIRNCA